MRLSQVIILSAVVFMLGCVGEVPSSAVYPEGDISVDAGQEDSGGTSNTDTGKIDTNVSEPDAGEDAGEDARINPDSGTDSSLEEDLGEDMSEPCEEETFYPDNDGDGYGNSLYPRTSCTPPQGYVRQGGDCEDSNSDVYPTAPEICDGVDNNCTGSEDDANDLQTFYRDEDGDGYGDPNSPLVTCFQPAGYVDRAGDCLDDPSDPMASETHQGADPMCAFPGDQNCNGVSDLDENPFSRRYCDQDGDGFGTGFSAIICPVMQDLPPTCSGSWVLSPGDADDTDAHIYPYASESCDGVDNDQDGTVDEGCSCISGTSEACGTDVGQCVSGIRTCGTDGQWSLCGQGHVGPTPETCDGLDNDCDGQTDESLTLGASCSTGQEGVCASGIQQCTSGQITCVALEAPQAEACDGLDNDCDGTVDEGTLQTYYRDVDGDSFGVNDPAQNTTSCTTPAGYADVPGDNCPTVPNPSQVDSNQNGYGDACEPCGDGTVGPGEQCDDGNTTAGDGCSSTCQLESGYICDPELGCTSTCAEYSGPVTIYTDEPVPVPGISDNSIQTGVDILNSHCSIDGQLDIWTSRSGVLTPAITALSSTPLKVKHIKSVFIQADALQTAGGFQNLLYISEDLRIRWDGANNYLTDTSHFHSLKEVGRDLKIESNHPDNSKRINIDVSQSAGHAPWESLETVNGTFKLFRVGDSGGGSFGDFPSLTYVYKLDVAHSALTPTQVCNLVSLSSVILDSNGLTCP